jgi:hypothetical protein
MKKTECIRISCLAVVLLGMCCVANAQVPYPMDEFLCYTVISNVPDFVATEVVLQDDMAAQTPATVTIRTGRNFCNAAEIAMGKTKTNIDNPADDLSFYDVIDGPAGTFMNVQVDNLFGPQTIETTKPTHLAVPTGKDPSPVPTALDHFLCYEARGPSIGKGLRVTDLWMRERVVVAFPSLFCNPVEKTHSSITYPVQHPTDHLLCYSVAELTFAPTANLDVTNQFGGQSLGVQQIDKLCVPTTVQGASAAPVVEE